MDAAALTVFWVVVGARFLLPLLIPRFPLPAVLACLVLDGVDQTIFQTMGYDPPGYQGYDKAMDVFYLSIAYLATLRNWTSGPAFAVARFLFFYRLVGVVAFELTDWRPLLVIFPNTFEYFFIAYEVVRLRWQPARYGRRFWVWTAALIWVVVKLPQEWWIHVAQLDFTDTVKNVPWFGPAVVVAVVALLLVFWFVVRPRLDPPDWGWRVPADPLPEAIDTAPERAAWVSANGHVFSRPTLEKVVLVGLVSIIYAQVLPAARATNAELFLGLAVFVTVNAAITLAAARAARTVESLLVAFLLRMGINLGLLWLAAWLLGLQQGGVDLGAGQFFVLLMSLLTALHDRFWPVHEVRAQARETTGAAPAPA